jgi:hypothetical protein
MALLKINGRPKFFNCDEIKVEQAGPGKFTVTYDRSEFTVVGGRAAGGRSTEWFCHHPLFYGEQWLRANSMVEAIRLGVQY